MKRHNGRRPTRDQKRKMAKRNLNPDEWLVLWDDWRGLHIMHRQDPKRCLIIEI